LHHRSAQRLQLLLHHTTISESLSCTTIALITTPLHHYTAVPLFHWTTAPPHHCSTQRPLHYYTTVTPFRTTGTIAAPHSCFHLHWIAVSVSLPTAPLQREPPLHCTATRVTNGPSTPPHCCNTIPYNDYCTTTPTTPLHYAATHCTTAPLHRTTRNITAPRNSHCTTTPLLHLCAAALQL
jgi:hypothetical protein